MSSQNAGRQRPEPEGPRRRWNPWLIALLAVAGAVVALAALGALIEAGEGTDPAPDETPTVTVTETETATEPAREPPTETVTSTATETAPPPDAPEDIPEEPPGDAPDTDVYYENCDEAPGPLTPGDPGYRDELDRDDDGVACEAN
jgi:type IV secretory pathway VirB10-like protein